MDVPEYIVEPPFLLVELIGLPGATKSMLALELLKHANLSASGSTSTQAVP
jgi:hypothetical protein